MRRPSLNHAYRLVWSDITQSYVAVAEHTKSRGKRKALSVAIALAVLPVLAGAAQIDDTSPNGYQTTSGQSHTVLIGATVEHSSAGTALGINPGGYEAPYGSTFINRGTIKSTGSLDDDTQIDAYGVHLGSAEGQSDLTGSFTNQAGASINVNASQNYQYVDLGDGEYGYTNMANALANGVGVSMGNVMGALTNRGQIGVSISNETNDASAIGVQVGAIGENGSINNSVSGTISASATSDYDALAKGIEINGDIDGTITNAGQISASAQGYDAAAYGIQVIPNNDGALGDLNANLSNAAGAKIEASADANGGFAQAAGILLQGGITEGVTLTNNGTIAAGVSVSGNLDSEGLPIAAGIAMEGDLDGKIKTGADSAINATIIQTNGQGGVVAMGVQVLGNMSETGALENGGAIKASATQDGDGPAYAAGAMFAGEDVAGTILNTGSIEANAITAKSSYSGDFQYIHLPGADGIVISGELTGTITNDGSITVTAKTTDSEGLGNVQANGIKLGGMGSNASLNNNGTLSVTAESAAGSASASGIITPYFVSGTVSNSGGITATANADTAAEASGIALTLYAYEGSSVFSDTLTNKQNATITAAATGASAKATGIAIDGFEGDVSFSGMLANEASASITATADASGSSAQATAIQLGGNIGHNGLVSNDGSIEATASASGVTSGNDVTIARGINVDGSLQGAIKTGAESSMTVSAVQHQGSGTAEATGIYIAQGMGAQGRVENKGGITVTAEQGDTGNANATGILFAGEGGMAGTLINDGTLSASASIAGAFVENGTPQAEAYGVQVAGAMSGTLNNSGTIKATAEVLYTTTVVNNDNSSNSNIPGDNSENSNENSNVTTTTNNQEPLVGHGDALAQAVALGSIEGALLSNTGSLIAEATSATGNADADGIVTERFVSGTITNEGSIKATATALSGYADADGIDLEVEGIDGQASFAGAIVNGVDASIVAIANGDDAEARAIQINFYDGDGTFSGTIANGVGATLEAKATGQEADAEGIHIGGDVAATGTILNKGTIKATADASAEGGYYAYADGIHIDGSFAGELNNEGTIEATVLLADGYDTAEANGVLIDDDMTAGSKLTNDGDITVTASAGSVGARASGINIDGDLSGSISLGEDQILDGAQLVNNGSVTVEATSDNDYTSANGIYIDGDIEEGASLANNGQISASASVSGFVTDEIEAIARGIEIDSDLYGTLTTDAESSITVTATQDAGFGTASATGIHIDNSMGAASVLNNAGDITATAKQADGGEGYAAGISVADGDMAGKLTNSGTIFASAHVNGMSETGTPLAEADGIRIAEALTGTLKNEHVIKAEATASDLEGGGKGNAQASGVRIGTIGKQPVVENNENVVNPASINIVINTIEPVIAAELTNNGSITATASSSMGLADAAGIIAREFESGTITNNGTISGSAEGLIHASAHGIFISGDVETNEYGVSKPAIGGNAAGSIVNSAEGVIKATAGTNGQFDYETSDYSYLNTIGNHASATGIGINGSMSGSLINSGTIEAFAGNAFELGDASASAITIVGTANQLTNDGTLNVTASARAPEYMERIARDADAYGIAVGGVIEGGALINGVNAAINVLAKADDDATAVGIAVGGNLFGDLTNNGSIDVTATAEDSADAIGIEVDSTAGAFQLVNNKTINATASAMYNDADATGVAIDIDTDSYAGASFSGTFTNGEGATITANASSLDDAEAIGVAIDVDGYYSATFSGTFLNAQGASIAAIAEAGEDAEATGVDISVYAGGYDDAVFSGTFANGEDATITANATTSEGGYYATAVAVNIDVDSSDRDALFSGSFTNEKGASIIATADTSGYYTAEATGVAITVEGDDGAQFTGTFTNGENALIKASATSNYDADATGVAIKVIADGYYDGSFSGNFTNNGKIEAIAEAGDDAEATGVDIYVYSDETDALFSGSFTNSEGATILAKATGDDQASATGVEIDIDGYEGSNFSGSFTNAKGATIQSIAEAGGYYASATGVHIGLDSYDSSVFSGTFTNGEDALIEANATATEGDAYATGVNIEIDGYEGGAGFTGTFTNAKGATIKATATATAEGYYGDADATAINLSVNGDFGGSLFSGSFTNGENATIAAVANASDEADSTGVAIDIDGDYYGTSFTGSFTNAKNAAITASADGYYANANAVDLSLYSDDSYAVFSGSFTNEEGALIQAKAEGGYSANARGVDIEIDGYEGAGFSGSFTNAKNATIKATATGEEYAYATGVNIDIESDYYGESSFSGTFTNAAGALIEASALAEGYYSYASARAVDIDADGYYGNGTFSGTFLNAAGATIKATATANSASATALRIGDNLAGELTNNGTISATANGGDSDGYATGIRITDSVASGASIVNTSVVKAAAAGGYAEAVAINVSDYLAEGATLTNSGAITANAAGNDASGAYAAGIQVGTLNGTIVNDGQIVGLTNSDKTNGYSVNAYSGSGSISNKKDALLQGNLYAGGSINVDNAGTIALTEKDATPAAGGKGFIAHGYVGGNYTQTKDGVLKIGAYGTAGGSQHSVVNSVEAPKSAGEYSTLTVEGDVEIKGKAFVDVRDGNTSVTKLAVGKKLDNVVVVGGNLIGSGFTAVDDNSFLFNFVNRVDEEGNIDLDIIRGGTVTQSADARRNRSGRGAAVVYDKIIDNGLATGDMVKVIDALDQLSGDKEVSNAVSQSSPLVSGQGAQSIMAGNNNVNKIVQSRQEGQLGRSSGDSFFGDKKFWFKPFGSKADQGSRDGAIGYDSTSYGMVFGADAVLSDVSRIGLAFSYAKTDVDSDSDIARQKADINSYNVVMYGSHSLTDATDISFQADVGYHKTDGERRIIFGGLDRTADASYDSWSTHFGVGLAHTVRLSEATSFTPSVRADYTYIKADSYRESGADALNLNVDSSTSEALVLGVDGKVTHAVTDKATVIANLGVGYDVLNERASLTSTFAGDTSATKFVTQGVDPSPWLMRGGFGIVGKITETTEITARYDFEVRDEFTNQTASVKLRWSF